MRRITRTAVIFLGLLAVPALLGATPGGSLHQLQALSDGFASVAAEVKPGVVAIVSEHTVSSRGHSPFRGTPWEHFFEMPEQPQREHRRPGQGSGVIVDYEGEHYILTNYHVVRAADEIRVELTDERHFEAEVVGADSLSDLAVLKIEAEDLPAVAWGKSSELRVGEWVMAIGNPFALEHTVTSGIISALGRARFGAEYGSFIQTDAAINPGNSGGALVNLRGELVGINTAIYSQSGGYMGIGFAIPVDLTRTVLAQLVEHGEVRRGLLGVTIADVGATTSEALGMEDTQGVLVTSVTPDGPADQAGVKAGDVLLAIDGERMRDQTQLKSRIGATAPETRVNLRILRKKREKTIAVTLGQLTEGAIAAATGQTEPTPESTLGMRLQELTPETARRYGHDGESGVLVAEVLRRSEAALAGLRPGDLIVEVNQVPVATIGDYEDAMEDLESGDAVLFLIQRRGRHIFITLRLP